MKQLCLVGLCLCLSLAVSSQSMKMVAIGSSTTSGTGAFPYDSSWVGRFTYYYKTQLGIASAVYNLGVPGATCYRGMPATYAPPLNREAPDAATNVSKAVQLLAGVPIPSNGIIIVGYPSNGYVTYSIPEIMQCLQTIYDSATRLGNRCFITTSQPRTDGGYNTPAIKRKLADIKDSIIRRFTAANTINCWDGLFNPADSSILPAYSAGDNVHFNNAGHRVLFERIQAMHVFSMVLPISIGKFTVTPLDKGVDLQWTAEQPAEASSFEIQRSQDGNHFQLLHKMAGMASAGQHAYQWTDIAPLPGISYYRLAFREGDAPRYSTTATITRRLPALACGAMKWQRGARQIQLQLTTDANQVVNIMITNSKGQVLQRLQQPVRCGLNNLSIALPSSPAGIYYMRISGTNGQSVTRSFLY